jgi:hypothetical protein
MVDLFAWKTDPEFPEDRITMLIRNVRIYYQIPALRHNRKTTIWILTAVKTLNHSLGGFILHVVNFVGERHSLIWITCEYPQFYVFDSESGLHSAGYPLLVLTYHSRSLWFCQKELGCTTSSTFRVIINKIPASINSSSLLGFSYTL